MVHNIASYSGMLILGIALTGCGSSSSIQAPTRAPQQVRVFAAQQDEITDYVELVARMAAIETVRIQSRVSGFLLEQHFEDGQKVQSGDLLFTIEPDQYQAIYNQSLAKVDLAKSELDVAEKTFKRAQQLIKTQAISREEFDQDEAEVAQAKANVAAAEADAARDQLDVKYTRVESPIDGRVDRSLVDEGNFVNGGLVGGTLLTTVVNADPIRAVANVDESLRLKVLRSMMEMSGEDALQADRIADLKIPCYLQLADEDGFPHEGVVDYVEIMVNEKTGTSQVRGVFENEARLFKPGMFARVKIPVTDPYQAVMVPDVAIGTDQTSKFVYVVSADNQVEQRFVELGDRRGEMRVIKSGLEPAERVVVAGMNLVQQGSQVEIVESPEEG